jgi:uncharacterized membrane protein
MDWDKHDIMWAIKFAAVALVWCSSVACMSFSLMANYPAAWQYTIITMMVSYLLYSPFRDYKKYKKRPDKILAVLNIVLYGWLSYITWMLTLRMLDYEKTGALPPMIVDPAWTHKWWAFLVYMGAWLCPIIYFSVKTRQRKEKLR